MQSKTSMIESKIEFAHRFREKVKNIEEELNNFAEAQGSELVQNANDIVKAIKQ